MSQFRLESDFLRYLLAQGCTPGSRLPSLNQISHEIGVSVGKLREQLEAARVLGLRMVMRRTTMRARARRVRPRML